MNAIIEQASLRDLPMNGRKYTWANNLPDSTYERSDRILICQDWEDKYPLATVNAMEREILDRSALLLDTGDHRKNQPIFRFENAWMLMEVFREFVEINWNIKCRGSSLDIWQSKLRNIRQKNQRLDYQS